MGIPAKYSTPVTRVSVTTLLAPGVTPSHEHGTRVRGKYLPHNALPTGTLLEHAVKRDDRYGRDRRAGAPPHRGRAHARPHAAGRARPARGSAPRGGKRAHDTRLPPRAR